MKRAKAYAKINLGLVVGPLRPDGKHEIVTVLQRIDLHDDIALEPARQPRGRGLRRGHDRARRRSSRLPLPPVSSRVGASASRSGSPSPRVSAAGAAMPRRRSQLANSIARRAARSSTFCIASQPVSAQTSRSSCTTARSSRRGDGTELAPVALPTDYHVLLVVPRDVKKESTADVYAALRRARRRRPDSTERAAAFRRGVRSIERRCRISQGFRRTTSPRRRSCPSCATPVPFARMSPAQARRSTASSRRADGARAAAETLSGHGRDVRHAPGSGGSISREWQDDPRSGAWPSGKATGFGPVIPGSNPGAPASVSSNGERTLGAVVMAAGLGTRMRSDVPKHLHPILGRRMVDWVLESARELGVRAARGRRGACNRGCVRRSSRRSPGRAAWYRRCRALRARGTRRRGGGHPRAVGRHPTSHGRRSARPRRNAPKQRRRRRPCSRSSRTTQSSTGASCATTTDGLAAIVEYRDATDEQRAVREVNSSIYVFRADRLWPVLDRLDAAQRAGRALPDRLGRASRRGGSPCGGAQGRRPGGDGGCEHASRAGCCCCGAPRADQRRRTCSRA